MIAAEGIVGKVVVFIDYRFLRHGLTPKIVNSNDIVAEYKKFIMV
jgi:hypothetical protein